MAGDDPNRPLSRKELRERARLEEEQAGAPESSQARLPSEAEIPQVPDSPPSIHDSSPDFLPEDPAPTGVNSDAHHDLAGAHHHGEVYYDHSHYEGEHGGADADGRIYGADYPYPDHAEHQEADFAASGQHEDLVPEEAGSVTMVGVPSKKVRRRRRALALGITLAVFALAIVVIVQFISPLFGSGKADDFPGPGSGSVMVAVVAGDGPISVASKLESQGVVANANTFAKALNASGGVLAPGEYTFRQEMANADAVQVLTGEGAEKVIYIALSAGLRVGESLQAIADGSGIDLAQLTALSDAPAQFGLPAAAKNLEGYLAPGEYRFPLGTSATDILAQLVKTTTDELVSQGITDPAKQYEAVIVASIVQAEGGQADYGNVAGAIYNRLKPNDQTGGFLQVDSAVTYGLGTRSFNFTDAEKADASNPYNTYANPGLPPGPIGSPGKAAIDAAARPTSNSYLYWVTINLDTGETKFSSTLAEHNGYVSQYNAWCEANAGRCT